MVLDLWLRRGVERVASRAVVEDHVGEVVVGHVGVDGLGRVEGVGLLLLRLVVLQQVEVEVGFGGRRARKGVGHAVGCAHEEWVARNAGAAGAFHHVVLERNKVRGNMN